MMRQCGASPCIRPPNGVLPVSASQQRDPKPMQRRDFLLGAAGAAAMPLGAPALAQGTAGRVLKFIPQSDVAVVDPIVTTAYVTRNHACLIYDTLFGIDNEYRAQPQMAEGQAVEDGGRRVSIS